MQKPASTGGKGDDLLLNVARCLLSDRDVMLVQMRSMNLKQRARVLRLLLLWHRAHGLRNLIRALRLAEDTCFKNDPEAFTSVTRDQLSEALIDEATKIIRSSSSWQSEGHQTMLGALVGPEDAVRTFARQGIHFQYALRFRSSSEVLVQKWDEFLSPQKAEDNSEANGSQSKKEGLYKGTLLPTRPAAFPLRHMQHAVEVHPNGHSHPNGAGFETPNGKDNGINLGSIMLT